MNALKLTTIVGVLALALGAPNNASAQAKEAPRARTAAPVKRTKRSATKPTTHKRHGAKASAKKTLRPPSSVIALPTGQVSHKAARDLLHDLQRRGANIHRQMRNARTKHNTKRVRCLDAKLTQIHTLERNSTREVQALRSALLKREGHIASWRMARIRTMTMRGAEITKEARDCGAAIRRRRQRTTRTSVRVMRRPNLPRYFDMPYWTTRPKTWQMPKRTATRKPKRR